MNVFPQPITAEEIKDRARHLGADLVGIADGQMMNEHPPDPERPARPCDISDYDADHVIVLARRINLGTTRIPKWNERHKYYNDELIITMLEQTALELVLWLEEQGYPALIVPPTHVDPWTYQGDPDEHLDTLLSLNHAAVEAGLGTLGLNLQLLTPEFGPRVILSAVLCSLPEGLVTDRPRTEGLCLGPTCGRCLLACPGDVIQHWDRDWPACDRYRSPHGFKQLSDHLVRILEEDDVDEKRELVRSRESFELWQSILRGAGVVTGCRRCEDVCPIGDDYSQLQDALDVIPEATAEKRARLATMIETEHQGKTPSSYTAQVRWIGRVAGVAGD